MQIEGLEKEKEALTKLDSLAGKGTVDLGAIILHDPATCVSVGISHYQRLKSCI